MPESAPEAAGANGPITIVDVGAGKSGVGRQREYRRSFQALQLKTSPKINFPDLSVSAITSKRSLASLRNRHRPTLRLGTAHPFHHSRTLCSLPIRAKVEVGQISRC
jgi:hypothetical protein